MLHAQVCQALCAFSQILWACASGPLPPYTGALLTRCCRCSQTHHYARASGRSFSHPSTYSHTEGAAASQAFLVIQPTHAFSRTCSEAVTSQTGASDDLSTHAHLYTWTRAHIPTHTSTHTPAHMHVRTHTNAHLDAFTCREAAASQAEATQHLSTGAQPHLGSEASVRACETGCLSTSTRNPVHPCPQAASPARHSHSPPSTPPPSAANTSSSCGSSSTCRVWTQETRATTTTTAATHTAWLLARATRAPMLRCSVPATRLLTRWCRLLRRTGWRAATRCKQTHFLLARVRRYYQEEVGEGHA